MEPAAGCASRVWRVHPYWTHCSGYCRSFAVAAGTCSSSAACSHSQKAPTLALPGGFGWSHRRSSLGGACFANRQGWRWTRSALHGRNRRATDWKNRREAKLCQRKNPSSLWRACCRLDLCCARAARAVRQCINITSQRIHGARYPSKHTTRCLKPFIVLMNRPPMEKGRTAVQCFSAQGAATRPCSAACLLLLQTTRAALDFNVLERSFHVIS